MGRDTWKINKRKLNIVAKKKNIKRLKNFNSKESKNIIPEIIKDTENYIAARRATKLANKYEEAEKVKNLVNSFYKDMG